MESVWEVLDNAIQKFEEASDDAEQEESKEQPLVQPSDEEERKEPINLNP